MSSPFSTDSLGDRPTFDPSSLGERSAFDPSSLGARPEYNEARREQTLANILSRAQPQRDRQRAAFDTRLVNQGFVRGSQGYDDAFDERNRADNDFRIAADLASGQESRSEFDQASRARQQGFSELLQGHQTRGTDRNQAFNELLTGYNTQVSDRDRTVNEMLQERNQPLTELSALLTGSQPQSPTFVGTPQGGVQAPDYAGLKTAETAALNSQYKQQVAQRNAKLSGLYGLAGAGISGAFAFSDRRLKRNIERIGKLANGLSVYAFEYIWGGARQVGLMADEVRQVHPDAVISIGGL